MINLDNIGVYKKFDKSRVAESIGLLADQIEQIWVDAKEVVLPLSFKKGIDKVVISGMGGSNLGFRIINSVFKDSLKAPLIIDPGYEVPNFVDQKTLYIISSYSGNTEEPLSTYVLAKKKKAKIICFTAKGSNNKLEDLMKKEKLPGFVFMPKNNPSGQPRLALGYSVFGAIKLLDKAGILKVDSRVVQEVVTGIRARASFWGSDVKIGKNIAKKIAYKFKGRTVVIVASEFLEGNIHALRNQFNENSKNLSFYLVSPDMNHYALEGLDNPKGLRKNIKFLFIDSEIYSKRTQKRNALVKQLIRKKGLEYEEVKLRSRNKISQSFELLQFGSWMSFYLALLNGVNPANIPWVNWFKDRLK